MVTCSAVGCSNRTAHTITRTEDGTKITFHLFPKNADLRNKWIKAVGRKNWMPTVRSALCSVHFTPDCFNRTLTVVRLWPEAVPTMFPADPSSLQPAMVTCSATKCPNTSTKAKYGSEASSGVSFHKFPKDEKRLKLWIKAIGRENWKPTKHSTLCSAHFEESCIVQTPQNHSRLRHDAVPTKFPQVQSFRYIHINLPQSKDPIIDDNSISPTILQTDNIKEEPTDIIHQPKEEVIETANNITEPRDIINQPKDEIIETATTSAETPTVIQGAITPAPVLITIMEIQYGKLKALYLRQRKMIRLLHERKRRNTKRMAKLKLMMTKLVEKNLINQDHTYV